MMTSISSTSNSRPVQQLATNTSKNAGVIPPVQQPEEEPEKEEMVNNTAVVQHEWEERRGQHHSEDHLLIRSTFQHPAEKQQLQHEKEEEEEILLSSLTLLNRLLLGGLQEDEPMIDEEREHSVLSSFRQLSSPSAASPDGYEELSICSSYSITTTNSIYSDTSDHMKEEDEHDCAKNPNVDDADDQSGDDEDEPFPGYFLFETAREMTRAKCRQVLDAVKNANDYLDEIARQETENHHTTIVELGRDEGVAVDTSCSSPPLNGDGTSCCSGSSTNIMIVVDEEENKIINNGLEEKRSGTPEQEECHTMEDYSMSKKKNEGKQQSKMPGLTSTTLRRNGAGDGGGVCSPLRYDCHSNVPRESAMQTKVEEDKKNSIHHSSDHKKYGSNSPEQKVISRIAITKTSSILLRTSDQHEEDDKVKDDLDIDNHGEDSCSITASTTISSRNVVMEDFRKFQGTGPAKLQQNIMIAAASNPSLSPPVLEKNQVSSSLGSFWIDGGFAADTSSITKGDATTFSCHRNKKNSIDQQLLDIEQETQQEEAFSRRRRIEILRRRELLLSQERVDFARKRSCVIKIQSLGRKYLTKNRILRKNNLLQGVNKLEVLSNKFIFAYCLFLWRQYVVLKSKVRVIVTCLRYHMKVTREEARARILLRRNEIIMNVSYHARIKVMKEAIDVWYSHVKEEIDWELLQLKKWASAVRIQCLFRAHVARNEAYLRRLKISTQAAIMMQSIWRMFQSRKYYKSLLAQYQHSFTYAATTIQKIFRSSRIRRRFVKVREGMNYSSFQDPELDELLNEGNEIESILLDIGCIEDIPPADSTDMSSEWVPSFPKTLNYDNISENIQGEPADARNTSLKSKASLHQEPIKNISLSQNKMELMSEWNITDQRVFESMIKRRDKMNKTKQKKERTKKLANPMARFKLLMRRVNGSGNNS